MIELPLLEVCCRCDRCGDIDYVDIDLDLECVDLREEVEFELEDMDWEFDVGGFKHICKKCAKEMGVS